MGRGGESFILKLRRLLARRSDPHADAQEKIEHLLEEVEEQGLISEEENDLLSSVLDFSETTVAKIMVPRPEIIGVNLDEPLTDGIRVLIESGHTRLPVYREDLDHIEGLLYAKDLLRYWGRSDEAIDPEDLLREPYFIPESKKIDELLREFQKRRHHIAIVIDEYGGTAGLITLEDIIEQVFGEIADEYDEDEAEPVRTEDGWTVVNPRIELGEIEELFPGVKAPDRDFTTLGGWILDTVGRIPEAGESIELGPLVAEIIEADVKHIITVRLKFVAGGAAEGEA